MGRELLELHPANPREEIPKAFYVHRVDELTDKQLKQLIEYARSDEMGYFDRDDERFFSEDLYRKWRHRDENAIPELYILTDSTNTNGNLYGIVWFRRKALPDTRQYEDGITKEKYLVTIGNRVYGNARGQRLAKDFEKFSIEHFLDLQENRLVGIWSEVHKDNTVSLHVDDQAGFKTILSQPDDQNETVILGLLE